jgi:O-acetyl-ADP-ribose deacetylase (regulator of RNase III)
LAVEHGVATIALPVLGSGIGGFDFEAAATIMRDAILGSRDTESLREVVLYGFLPDHAARLERLLG